MMQTQGGLGTIYKSWPTVKKTLSWHAEYIEHSANQAKPILQEYARSGSLVGFSGSGAGPESPPMERIHRYLDVHAHSLLSMAESEAIQDREYEYFLAKAFAAMKPCEMVRLMIHDRFPSRFRGRQLRQMSLKSAALIAVAIALGDRSEAEKLGRALVEAYKRNYFFDSSYYPVYNFVMRLFCDWQEISFPEDIGPRAGVMQELLQSWRGEDVDALKGHVMLACNYHTHRCRPDSKNNFYEFSNIWWSRFPIEFLMLFRLRKWSGLDNPIIDHPLMSGAFNRLPKAVPLLPDELTAAVLLQMRNQGYDEAKIVSSLSVGFVTSEP